ncbi:MAG TPA: PhnD/SsuA/transferrin family substrate-binding protein [Myxococcales bacterium]|nr:PhnD/SsuA/transferrin family substrate-binding protein [Myxococcales bacterium]
MKSLVLASLMAPNADPFYRALARYLADVLGRPVRSVDRVDWTVREQMLHTGKADFGFVCGLQYVQVVDRGLAELDLLVAAVPMGARYRGEPIYFSDVIVKADSPFKAFDDLRGRSWAFNEPTSHSGYNVARYHVALKGVPVGFFRQVVSGEAHQNSLRLVARGLVDAAAIDSTVLEQELLDHPELAQKVRIIDSLGPSPIPPGVIGRDVPAPERRALRAALLAMHERAEGRKVLALARYARFAAVTDLDYDRIREMARLAETVRLSGDTAILGPVVTITGERPARRGRPRRAPSKR